MKALLHGFPSALLLPEQYVNNSQSCTAFPVLPVIDLHTITLCGEARIGTLAWNKKTQKGRIVLS
jgi:hypothetical protein